MTALADERREGTEALHVASVELEKLRLQSKHWQKLMFLFPTCDL